MHSLVIFQVRCSQGSLSAAVHICEVPYRQCSLSASFVICSVCRSKSSFSVPFVIGEILGYMLFKELGMILTDLAETVVRRLQISAEYFHRRVSSRSANV